MPYRAERQQYQEAAQGDRQHGHILEFLDLARRLRRREGGRLAARDPRRFAVEPTRHHLHIRAGPQRDLGDVELEGIAGTVEDPVVAARGNPRSGGVAVVRSFGDETDAGDSDGPRRRRAGQLHGGAGGGVQLLRCRGGQNYLIRGLGHPPGCQHDGEPLAADRVIGVGRDGCAAGVGDRDPCIVEAGDVMVAGDGSQLRAGR